MEMFLISQLTKELKKTIKQCRLNYGNIGFMNEKRELDFVTGRKYIPGICLEIVRSKKEQCFKSREAIPKKIDLFYGIPIMLFNDGLGIVICGGCETSVLNPDTQQLFRNIAKQAAFFLYCERIKELSLLQWGQPITFIGFNSLIMETKDQLERFAQSDVPLLITGESGVGKEIFAKSCYLLSKRRGKAYYSINCGQFQNEDLLVSELFGHKKGSFTGAAADRPGIFEMANGGMVFLDEIGELSPAAQKMLLRVIDKNEIKPLGSNITKQVDLRIVSATHRNLVQMTDRGSFREDLYYRLSALHLLIPPLRQRGEDPLLLLNYFLEKINEEHGIRKKFSEETIEYLNNYSFPGNIRELMNIVETGFWVSRGTIIELTDITTRLRQLRSRRGDDNPEKSLQEIIALNTEYLRILTEHLTKSQNSLQKSADNQSQAELDPYRQMVDQGQSFWDAVKEPFMKRDLKRSEVRNIIRTGLQKSGGKYKKLLSVFNIQQKDHKRFLDFLGRYNLQP